MLEKHLEKKLKQLVTSLGGVAYKIDARANRGVPDRVVLLCGRQPFFLELKTETGVVSPLQEHQHAKIRAAGGQVFIAYGWEQVEEIVRAVTA